MALGVFHDSVQGAGFIISIVFTALCTLATGLRFIATKQAGRRIWLEDWFALFGLAFFLSFTTIFIYVLSSLNGRSFAVVAKESPTDLQHIFMVALYMSAQYCGNQLFSKWSLLAFYHRLFFVERRFVICVWVVAILQLMWFIGTYVAHYLTCIPIAKVWDPTIPGTCINNSTFLIAGETINSLIDFVMIGLAVWMVVRLQMDTSTKWKISFLFVLGGLSGIIGFIKIGTAHNSSYSTFLDPLWAVVQMAFSILCSCLPVYKSLLSALPDLGIVRALRSWTSRSALRESSNEQSTNNSYKLQKPVFKARDQNTWGDRDKSRSVKSVELREVMHSV
ncbi:hypothetical protein F5Y16DRAFT_391670 [Xylariaceae sp. FL0255]|nr:hypothetical protein F5Y16DRAFT_391670 [Xylariaceae sp. FL0255]